MPGFRLLLAAIVAATSLHAGAAVTNVDLGTPLPRFALLHEGTHPTCAT